MNNLNKLNEIIDYIENHLTGDIDIETIAQKANMSIYEFRRIFSFIAGIPLSEYIWNPMTFHGKSEFLSEPPEIRYY